MPTDVTTATFDTEVLQHDGPVLVDFWAAWCGPCRQLSPVLDSLAEDHPGLKIAKVNIDEEMDLAMRYQVTSIPALKLFVKGDLQAEALGAMPKGALEAKFGDLLD